MKNKIVIDEETLEKTALNGDTLSYEGWLAMTEDQRKTLENWRRDRLRVLSGKVRDNENSEGIWNEMNEHRALRIRLIAGREREIRDLYFRIADSAKRITAINDLWALERFRFAYFHSTRAEEAYYKVLDAEKKAGRWTLGKGDAVELLVGCAGFYLLGRFVFRMDDVLVTMFAALAFMTWFALIMRKAEANKAAVVARIEWELEKAKKYDDDPCGLGKEEAVFGLFCIEERETGRRVEPRRYYR
jgi:hypothetical protein